MLYRRIEDYGTYRTALVDCCCDCSFERLATFTTFTTFTTFEVKAYVFGMGHLKKDNIFTIFCTNIVNFLYFTVKIW